MNCTSVTLELQWKSVFEEWILMGKDHLVFLDVRKTAEMVVLRMLRDVALELVGCSNRVPFEDWSSQVEWVEVVDDFILSVHYHQVTRSRPGGQNSSIALDQTGYGAIRRAHWGALNRTFPAPYSPASALSVETPCFGPWTRVPRSEQKKSGEMAPNLNRRRGWPGGMPEGPWEPRGAWAELN